MFVHNPNISLHKDVSRWQQSLPLITGADCGAGIVCEQQFSGHKLWTGF